MTTLNRLPVLEKRRIQAEVIRPVWLALKVEIGEEKARRIISTAIVEAAIAEGKQFADEHGGPSGDTWLRLVPASMGCGRRAGDGGGQQHG